MIKIKNKNIYIRLMLGFASFIAIMICILPFTVKTSAYENSQNIKDNSLEGKWIPFMAEYNGEEIPLSYYYGSGISEYGGYLEIKEDGTYTELIGVYSPDNIDSKIGKYINIDNNALTLVSNSGEEKAIKRIENMDEYISTNANIEVEKNTIVLTSKDNMSIYFKK